LRGDQSKTESAIGDSTQSYRALWLPERFSSNVTQLALMREELALFHCRDLPTGVPMQRYQLNQDRAGHRFVWTAGTAFLAAHGVLLLILATLVIASPHAGEWISDTVQAEFVGPDVPVMPTQLAQPAGEMRTVGAN